MVGKTKAQRAKLPRDRASVARRESNAEKARARRAAVKKSERHRPVVGQQGNAYAEQIARANPGLLAPDLPAEAQAQGFRPGERVCISGFPATYFAFIRYAEIDDMMLRPEFPANAPGPVYPKARVAQLCTVPSDGPPVFFTVFPDVLRCAS